MIRRRVSRCDDRSIFSMIRRYLLPMKRVHFPDAKIKDADLKQRLKKGTTYVSTSKGEVTGFCHAFLKKDVLWIDLIAVEKKAQRKGIGAQLLKRAESFGIRRGCRTIQLFVNEENRGALQFYLRNGYRIKQYVQPIYCYLLEKECGNQTVTAVT